MKKPRLSILIAVTLLFAVFTLGFFLGRNGSHGSVELSVPASMQTSPPQTTLPEPTTPETVAVTFPIDINRADTEQLTELGGTGIGAVAEDEHLRLELLDAAGVSCAGAFPEGTELVPPKGIRTTGGRD